MEENNNDSFVMEYSAKNRKEIEQIRKKYAKKADTEDKLEELRRLDHETEAPAQIAGMTVGIIGTLIFGFGMAAVMAMNMTIIGVVSGIIGLFVVFAAYPFYKKILESNKEKNGARILELSEELLK